MLTGPELAFLYLFGLLDALQLKYNIRVLVCVLVYTHIGVLDNAKSEPAELFITYQHACRRSCRTTSTHKTYAALPLAACCRVRACVRPCERVRRRHDVRRHALRACVALRDLRLGF